MHIDNRHVWFYESFILCNGINSWTGIHYLYRWEAGRMSKMNYYADLSSQRGQVLLWNSWMPLVHVGILACSIIERRFSTFPLLLYVDHQIIPYLLPLPWIYHKGNFIYARIFSFYFLRELANNNLYKIYSAKLWNEQKTCEERWLNSLTSCDGSSIWVPLDAHRRWWGDLCLLSDFW